VIYNFLNRKCKLYLVNKQSGHINNNVNKNQLQLLGEERCAVYTSTNRNISTTQEWYDVDLTLILQSEDYIQNNVIVEFEDVKYKIKTKKKMRQYAPNLKNQGVILGLIKYGDY